MELALHILITVPDSLNQVMNKQIARVCLKHLVCKILPCCWGFFGCCSRKPCHQSCPTRLLVNRFGCPFWSNRRACRAHLLAALSIAILSPITFTNPPQVMGQDGTLFHLNSGMINVLCSSAFYTFEGAVCLPILLLWSSPSPISPLSCTCHGLILCKSVYVRISVQ